jgi:hypothetical protein
MNNINQQNNNQTKATVTNSGEGDPMPNPPNIHEIETSYGFLSNLNVYLLIFGGLIAIAIAVVALLSNRKGNELKEAQKNELTIALKNKDIQIEAAKAVAEKAKSDAEKAKATAAEANTKTVSLNLKVEEEARKRAEAELALETLRAKLRGRFLSQGQKEILLQVLKGLPKARITIVTLGDKEAAEYAAQIISAFREAGVIVDTFNIGVLAPPQYGIVVSPVLNMSPFSEAFKKAKINFTIGQIPGPQQNGILIGLKPPIET